MRTNQGGRMKYIIMVLCFFVACTGTNKCLKITDHWYVDCKTEALSHAIKGEINFDEMEDLIDGCEDLEKIRAH